MASVEAPVVGDKMLSLEVSPNLLLQPGTNGFTNRIFVSNGEERYH